jgi:hypothetical protein
MISSGQPRARLAALDVATAEPLSWNPGTSGEVRALAIEDGALYVGGGFTTAAGVPRSNLAAIDASSGTALAWDAGPDKTVNALVAASPLLLVGGSFFSMARQPQAFAAAITGATVDVAGGSPGGSPTARLEPCQPNPFHRTTAIRFWLTRPEVVSIGIYDLAGREIATVLKGRTLAPGEHRVPVSIPSARAGVYLCHMTTPSIDATQKMVVLP